MNRVSQNPQVPALPRDMGSYSTPGVRVHYFWFLVVCQFPFVFSQWLLWRRVTNRKYGSSFVYKYQGQFNFIQASVFCCYVRIVSFLTCKDDIAGPYLLLLYFHGSVACFFLLKLPGCFRISCMQRCHRLAIILPEEVLGCIQPVQHFAFFLGLDINVHQLLFTKKLA